ncbi:MAG: hypothetical protein KJ619_04675 [Candidatus Omnitrophica bacterium]|nr:hypothetical protein [Candidatus Omnitrophota bacterium]MBU2251493.1 hypothetical protein [Candidatus Omnitrophota bacterium]MBU2473383.1 hypothetical protein [Candidatus Omnitrophota bacterium]
MPYDSNLDEKIFSKSWESDTTKITVGVFSYNKGAKKMQVTRENRDSNGDFRFTRLGRMSKDEVEAILPVIQEAAALM